MAKITGICQICFKTKSLLFSTERISICRQCADILKGETFLSSAIKTKIELFIEKRMPYKSIHDAYNESYGIIKSKLSGIEKIISIFYLSDEHKERVNSLAKEIKARSDKESDCYRADIFTKLINDQKFNFEVSLKERFLLWRYRAFSHSLLSGKENFLDRPTKEVWDEVRKSIIHEDGLICNICGKDDKGIEYHLHHIIPLHQYGTNHDNNLVLLCRSCHQKQHRFKISKNYSSKKSRSTSLCSNKTLNIEEYASRIELEGCLNKNEKIIINCPSCNRELRIPCGAWIYVYCQYCFFEFEAKGNFYDNDFETRPR